MKKRIRLIMSVLFILLLASCEKQPQNLSSNASRSTESAQTKSSSCAESAESVKPADPTELAALRKNMIECNCMLGVGFFGYVDSESDEATVRAFAADSALVKDYPFLADCTPILTEGAELYALVPVNSNTSVTLYPAEISADGTYIDRKDAPIYTGKPGETVVLRCNLSEVYANVLLSVSDGANTITFHPMISMESGCLIQEPGCFDFSVYEMTEEERAQNASDLLTATDEVKDALGRGMKLLYTGDTQVVNGQQCLLFAIGTEHEEQFVREQLYAVADGQIYAYSAVTDSWEPLGAG